MKPLLTLAILSLDTAASVLFSLSVRLEGIALQLKATRYHHDHKQA